MKLNIELAFKKLLGKGRAWRAITTKTSEIIDVFVSPLSDVFKYFKNLKYTHFPTTYLNESNIENGEELFEITEIEGKTLEERAANVESQWTALSGSQTWQQLENILKRQGIEIKVIENIPKNYNMYGARYIGNGFLQIKTEKTDPVAITNYKHTFIIQAVNFLSEESINTLINTIVKAKPMHNVAMYIPRFLRKKEIHGVMTKNRMQQYQKRQYCDCKTPGRF